MSVEQCRAARGLLNWSAAELAASARVGIATVKRFESGVAVQPITIDMIRSALEAAGVVIIAEGETSKLGGRGVRLAETAAAAP